MIVMYENGEDDMNDMSLGEYHGLDSNEDEARSIVNNVDRQGGSEVLEVLYKLSTYKSWRVFVVLAWIALTALGGLSVGSLFDDLKDELDPKSSSRSIRAFNMFNEKRLCYPYNLGFVVYESVNTNVPVLNISGVRQAITNLQSQYFGVSYYDTVNGNPLAKPVFVDSDESATVLWAPFMSDSSLDGMYDDAVNGVSGLSNVRVRASMFDSLQNTNSDAATNDLKKMDAIAIPLALLVLGLRLRSVTMLVVPIITLVVSLMTTFFVLDRVQHHGTHFPSFSPALFTSSAVALNFDWSLFVLTRYREACKAGATNTLAVREVVLHVFPAVLMSGGCLVLAFLSLAVMPSKFISHTGIGATITILASLLVNITLLPVLLLSCGVCTCRRSNQVEQDEGTSMLISTTDAMGHPILTDKEKKSIWYGLVQRVVKYPIVVLVVLLVAIVPLAVLCAKFRTTIDQNQIHPRDTRLYHDWSVYNEKFASSPAGILSLPYALVVKPLKSSLTVQQQAELLVLKHNELIAHLTSVLKVPPSVFSGPTYVNGVALDAETAIGYLNSSDDQSPMACLSRFRNLNPVASGCVDFNQVSCRHISSDFTMFYTEIDPNFDPQGEIAEYFIERVREAIDKFNTPNLVEFGLAFGLTEMYDVKTEVISLLPYTVLATLGILLVCVLFAYKSVAMAFRLVVTIGINLVITFGIAVIIFQSNFFNGTANAVYWMAPTLTLSLVVGLAADYDFFLTSRIREAFHRGLSNEEAIVYGYTKTGGVITTAGVIMGISFGALMLSSQLLLIQCGFFLSFSVLLDTFAIRSFVVPAIMKLCGKWNWWPGVSHN